MIKIRVNPGEEVTEVLTAHFQKAGIHDGAIVSVIGAVDQCCIINMTRQDAKKDVLNEYNEPLELAGTGEIREGKPHIHCVLGREGDEAISGHLHWARVETWFVTVFVIPM